MPNPNLNDFTFDEKYQAANALLNVPDNSFQEASSEQPDLNLNQQNMNKQPDLNLNQQEIPNHQFNLNQSIMNYAAQLNGLQINPNENITSNINKLLFIELLNLSQPGQSLNHSAVPQSKDIKLVPSSNLENNSLDSKDKVDNIISPPNNSNIKDIKHVPSSTFKDINLDTNHNGNFKVNNLNSKKTEEKSQENDSISSISIPLEAKLTSLIESLNATNQTNQMIGLSFLISNKNTTKMLVQQEKMLVQQEKMIDQQGKMIDQQGKILELLMEERNERKQKEKNAELSKNGKKNSDI